MRRRGVTLIETMVCLAIAAVLAAILLPVLHEARDSAHRSTTVSNFRQIHAALSLYRSGYDGDGVYGAASKMGLPRDLKVLAVAQNLPEALFRSGCASIRTPVLNEALFRLMWHEDQGDVTMQDWAPYATQYRGDAVMIGDDNCDFRDRFYKNPLVSHRVIGLYEAGNVRTFVKGGDRARYQWWNIEENEK